MGYHILTGDCLAENFRNAHISGEVIVCRECLVEGPLNADTDEGFWEARAEYLCLRAGQEEDFYYRSVKGEFDKLAAIDRDAEVCLWFEHDLFCQVNYWLTIDLLIRHDLRNVYRVSPQTTTDGKWDGFCNHTGLDLEVCYANKVKFTRGDFTLGENLWQAYREGDIVALATYSRSLSPAFPRLEEVCKAEVERKRNSRPQKTLEAILSSGFTNFNDIFHEFNKKEGIYGFGDVQVNNILRGIRRA
jgi:hypothetical protein